MVFLGVDGGGTSTRALATDETGAVIGRGAAGPSNPLSVGWEPAIAAIVIAARATGMPLPADAAFFGLAGVGREAGKVRMAAALEEAHLARRFEVGIDAEIALAGAHGGEPGAIVSAGTGAIALARSANGTLHRADGWGHLLGDEGSGYWIGCEALQTVCRIADGRALGCHEDADTYGTALQDAILRHFGVASLQDLVTRIYDPSTEATDIAALAPVVATCAEAGDSSAISILRLAGYELAPAARAVLRAANLPHGPLSCLGGVFSIRDELVLEPFAEHLQARERGILLRPPLMSPVEGATLLARTLAH